MAIRELLKKNRGLAIGLIIAVVVAAAFFSFVQSRGAGRAAPPTFATKVFYTTDEGATLFADDADKSPPFDHEGQPAVRAFVFSCDGGLHRWVQYLQKYNEQAKAKSEPNRGPNDDGGLSMHDMVIKKPGGSKWVPMMDPRAADVMKPSCPDGSGSGKPEQVFP